MSIAVTVLIGLALLAALVIFIDYEVRMRRRWDEDAARNTAAIVELHEIRRLVNARDGEPTPDEVARELARLRGKLRESAEWLASSAGVIQGLDDGCDIDGEITALREFVEELFRIAGPPSDKPARRKAPPPTPRSVA